MHERKSPGGLAFFGIAGAGIVVGHALAYLMAIPDHAARERILSWTGHAYLPAAVEFVIVLAFAGAGSMVLRRITRSGASAPPPALATAARLAGVQVPLFTAMEVLERLAARAPVGEMVHDHVLLFGLAAQALIAIVGALFLRWLTRAADRLAGWLSPSPIRRPRAAIAIVPATPGSRTRLLVAPIGPRSPPTS